MESDSLRLLRQRRAELWARLEDVRARVKAHEAEIRQIDAGITAMERDNPLAPTGNDASLRSVAHFARVNNPGVQSLTMKQLVMKALSEHFKAGATANELLEFFSLKWGRNEITRTSLSPQLSRLKAEGKIKLLRKTWLTSEAFEELRGGAFPFNENEPHSGDAGGSDTDQGDAGTVPEGLDQPIPSVGSTS